MQLETKDKPFGRVDYERRGKIAVLWIKNPPVNAGSHAVRSGLVAGIDRAAKENASGVIIVGAGRCFVAGSDLREFGQPLQKPELPDVIRTIEDAPFPVVAALHGVALGGGLELSLGCDYRVALSDTQLGLPEVSLGFVPGAGGTQRLPRLIGVARSIELICASKRIPASQAETFGLVDAVLDGDLVEGAEAFLKQTARPKRRAAQLKPPQDKAEDIHAAATKAIKRAKGQGNVAEAIRLVKSAADTTAETALADERAVFQRLRVSDQAFALRYLFFAERQAASVDGIDQKAASQIKAIGVVGGGTMGQGITRAFLAAGIAVTLMERDEKALTAALTGLSDALEAQVSRGRLSEQQKESWLAQLKGSVDVSAFADVNLVIEAVFEDMSVKKGLLSSLEEVVSPSTILATNTSYLDINEMVADLSHPERVLGLHFFSPADIMKLLEIVRADTTSNATLATGLKLSKALGKQTVVARVGEGFIGNRIYAAYRRRAELLVLDGASPDAVDKAITDFGMAMGVFAVSDMSGLDIAWAMRKRQSATRDPQARYVTIPDILCEMGRLGRKTGKGWYRYDGTKALPDPKVDAVIASAREAASVSPRAFSAVDIQRQLMAAILNEAACLLQEGIAQRASDIDVAFANGYGFPRWRGGPLYWAAQQDVDEVMRDQTELAKSIGHGFVAGPVQDILNSLRVENKSA